MKDKNMVKSDRILHLYLELSKGKTLRKKDLAQQFHVTERSIQRDISSLQCFLAEHDAAQDVMTGLPADTVW